MKFPLCLAIFVPLAPVFSGGLEDAQTILRGIDESIAVKADSPVAKFKAASADYASKSAKMSAQEAADGWLALNTEWEKAMRSDQRRHDYTSEEEFQEMIGALPPPGTWDELSARLAAKQDMDPVSKLNLSLLLATLRNDPAGQWKAFGGIRDFIKEPPKKSGIFAFLSRGFGGDRSSSFFASMALSIAGELSKIAQTKADLERSINDQIEIAAALDPDYDREVDFSNVVQFLGTDATEKLVTTAIDSGVVFTASDTATADVIRKVVITNIARLKVPVWSLVDGIGSDQITLFEEYGKRFSKDKDFKSNREPVEGNYVRSLLVFGRVDEAQKVFDGIVTKDAVSFALSEQEQSQFPEAQKHFFEFLKQNLEKQPALPYWNDLVALSIALNRKDEAVALAESASANKDVPPKQRDDMLYQLERTFLAAGEVDKGVSTLSERIDLALAEDPPQPANALSFALKMNEIGKLVERQDIVDRAAKVIRGSVPRISGKDLGDPKLIKYLVAEGSLAEAQKQAAGKISASLADRSRSRYLAFDMDSPLANLAGLYDIAEQPEQVIALLQDAPWWGKADLSEICGSLDFRGTPAGIIAAKAFVATGDSEKAVRCLKATIAEKPAKDAAYGMLVDIEGISVLPFLDERFAEDRFEERPLIWKASLLLKEGQIDEAEKTIRMAIAIDPSDGEMGKGDRMRAYAVLADILDKKGDAEGARLYRNAVAAIRIAETGDELRMAGLESLAIDRYKEALRLFADAYCIQSRLAVQLADMGRTAEAEEHYRRAYELMPDSFGRMESHCFGCERAFKGPLAESIAEKTFTQLIQKSPDKPQLYYLLGYLRKEQGRDEEALAQFTKAVELDPDYLNAWKMIVEIAGRTLLPGKVRDDATFALLRLDPSRKHVRPGFSQVVDLARLWTLAAELQGSSKPRKPSAIFPLTASEKALNKNTEVRHLLSTWRNEGPLSPPKAVAGQDMIKTVTQTLSQIARIRE